MPVPAFNVGDNVQFIAPFTDNVVYKVNRIQYLTELGEASETVTDYWQYELVSGITNSVEDYLEAAP